MSDYRNQHTITKAYLRGFANDASPNTLWRYNKNDGSCNRRSIRKATVKFHAYSFRDTDGQWNHNVERFLSKIESTAMPLLSRVEAGEALTLTERSDFALFIGTMIRRPAGLLDHSMDELVQQSKDRDLQLAILDRRMSELVKTHSVDDIEAARTRIANGETDFPLDRAKAIMLQVWIENMPKYSTIIADMEWQLWTARKGNFFITSDAPACVRRGHHDNDPGVVGIAHEDAEITFPLSKENVLIARHSRLGKPRQMAAKGRVDALNGLVVRMAHKDVYASLASDHIKQIVLRTNAYSAPMPDFSALRQRADPN
jgi:hypothetical protein